MNEKTFQNAITLFDKLGKINVKPLYRRIKEHNTVQRSIDELALEMLGSMTRNRAWTKFMML